MGILTEVSIFIAVDNFSPRCFLFFRGEMLKTYDILVFFIL